MNKDNIAIIPARSGSKRIKNKNIKIFHGKPIILWTLKHLKKSKLFKKVILTTDSKEYFNFLKNKGFDEIIIRPKSLSNDYAITQDVIKHSIEYLNKKKKIVFENVCCVYPCNPFFTKKDLTQGLKNIEKNKTLFSFPVTQYSHPIQRAFIIQKKQKMKMREKKFELTRTQDLTETFHDVGQFYWGKKKLWLSKKRIHTHSIGIKTPTWRSIDIDHLNDWKRAELIFKYFRKNEKN